MSELATRLAALSPAQRALLAERLRGRDDAPEPIAIVGMGCRFPGADGVEPFWRLLHHGVDAIGEVPPERWDVDAWYDPDPRAPGKISSRWGGFLRDVDRFDAGFFGISPREAASMDPQHRLLLEVTAEALEAAGQTEPRLRGSRTGVYAAVYQRDYARWAHAHADAIDAYTSSGTHHSLAANRLSFLFDLRGPSLTVDTACSSSLVALHLACRGLLGGECQRAVVAASNLILAPEESVSLSRWGMLAADGRCKTFDSRADGFVRGEGCAALILKRLSDARADGDEVLALILGTAVNQDGRSNGLTAPNLLAQQAVVREALAAARVDPARVGYVEAHGTGTALGDPIEVEALRAVVGAPRADGTRCYLGSVKSNIGHLEAAAGLAGVVKTVLALRHEAIPASLHVRAINPRLALEGTSLAIATRRVAWPATGPTRVAGVSAFGVGGTNAHVILEEPPRGAPADAAPPAREAHLLTLSAHGPEALADAARALHDVAAEGLPAALAELCATAALRRTHRDHRLAVVAADGAELRDRLGAHLAGEARPGLSAGRAAEGTWRGLVFVLPGQGSQWRGMGSGLAARPGPFRDAFEACHEAVRAEGGASLFDALAEGGAGFDRVDVIQPLLFALQVSLAALWRALGIVPDAVVGHSMGEVAAAHVAGALTLADAARVITRRSGLLARSDGGAMLSVELSFDDALALVAREPRVAVAASNGPAATVLSGDAEALAAVAAALDARGLHCRFVKVDVASHSPAMDALERPLLDALAGLRPTPAAFPLYSTVTGALAVDGACDATYWWRNLRRPVRFWPTIERLLESDHRVFVELSAHPTLLPAIEQGLAGEGRDLALLPSLRRGEDGRAAVLGSLAALYTRGFPVRWEGLYTSPRRPVALPRYPFQRERFWLDPPGACAPCRLDHPFVGEAAAIAAPPGRLFPIALDVERLGWLADHRVQRTAVVPGTAYLEMALASAAPGACVLGDVCFERPCYPGERRELQLQLSDGGGPATFQIHGRAGPGDHWILHARGAVLDAAPAPPRGASFFDAGAVRARCREWMTGEAFYALLARSGNDWGPAFQGIERLWLGDDEMLAEVRVPASIRADVARYRFHPALLDACGQALTAAVVLSPRAGAASPFFFAGLDRLVVHGRPGARSFSHAVVRRHDGAALIGDVRVADEDGRPVVEMIGLRIRLLDAEARRPARDERLYTVGWRARPAARPTHAPPASWLVIADRGGVGARLAATLGARGARCAVITPADAAAALSAAPGPRAVVDLRALDAPALDAVDVAELRAVTVGLCAGALTLLDQLCTRGEPDRLWLVTRGAQPVAPGPLGVLQSPLLGLGRVIAVEHPEHFGGMIDLDPRAPDADAGAVLADVIAGSDGEPEIAFRGGARYAPRLARHAVGDARAPELAPDASYLITGGLGDLGLCAARWLVERGARRLVLIGRSAVPARRAWAALTPDHPLAGALAGVRAIESLGVAVHVAQVDVGDERALAAFLGDHRDEGWPPIRGVLHCAGVQHVAPLRALDAGVLGEDFHAKIAGAVLLARHLPALDFLVLYSSAATLFGSPFLGGYTAASAFLDALACHLHASGRAAISVDWGYWSELGMARRFARERDRGFVPRGMLPFTAEEGLGALDGILADPPARVGVVSVDWAAWRRAHPTAASAPLFDEIDAPEAPPLHVAGDDALTGARDALGAGTPAAARRRAFEAYLIERVARVLRLAPGAVDPSVALVRLGLDSLTAVELKNRIRSELALVVPIVTILSSAGVSRLSAALAELAPEPLPRDEWEEMTL